jgi:hypothetical protein
MAPMISLNPIGGKARDKSDKSGERCGEQEASDNDGYCGGFHG